MLNVALLRKVPIFWEIMWESTSGMRKKWYILYIYSYTICLSVCTLYRLYLLSTCICALRKQPPSTQPVISSCLWAGPLSQSTPLCLKAGLFFSFASLPTTASQPVNHTTRPHCAAWPTGTLAMATQIPADLAVKKRRFQKYERREYLNQCACMGFVPQTKMAW